VFTRIGFVGAVVVAVLAGRASAAGPALPDAVEEGALPVRPAIYRVEQAATPAVGEPQTSGTGVLKAELELWRGGGVAGAGRLPVTNAIYRVELPEPGDSPSTDTNSAEDESESTGTDVKFDLVRWHGGWGRGWGWGGGWGRGWGWRRGWGVGYRGWGWGGYRRFGWGWGAHPGWGWGYRPRFYRPFFYGGWGYPGYGYAYNGFGYGGYPLAFGYGYPMYGGYW
jgi:hypothetical protein